jgi:hypothetical protein
MVGRAGAWGDASGYAELAHRRLSIGKVYGDVKVASDLSEVALFLVVLQERSRSVEVACQGAQIIARETSHFQKPFVILHLLFSCRAFL